MIRALALALALALPSPVRAQATAAYASSARPPMTGPVRPPASTAATGRAVVSAAEPLAAEAGLAMLRAGGSAADAAAATAIALTVVEPQSSGLGGGAFVLYHDARTGRDIALDGRETAPAAARPDRFLGPDGRPLDFGEAVWGGRSVGVPGLIAVLAELHARHGKLPWARLFDPAIALARDGWRMDARQRRFLGYSAKMVAASPLGPIFVGADGTALPEGTLIRQTALAATLAALARGGPRAFYTGPLAADIARAVSAAPRGASPMTADDLGRYRAIVRTPLCGMYRGWRLCGMGPPSGGGIAVLQMLAQIERFDIRRLGPENPLAWHLLAESERLAYADRAAWGGDPGFVAVPADGLLDAEYLRARSALIRVDRAMPHAPAGQPPGAPRAPGASDAVDGGTSHLAVVDDAGNVASITSTIESVFGSGQVAGGFFLNNELTDFDFAPGPPAAPAQNRVQPGKRPLSSMAPFLLYAPDGRIAGAVGAAGGITIPAQVAKTLVAMIDWRMSPEAAIAAPVLFAIGDRVSLEPGTRIAAMTAALKALGHEISARNPPFLKTNIVVRAPGRGGRGGGWRGAGDPRTDGQAVAAR